MARSPAARAGLHAGRGSGSIHRLTFGSFRGQAHGHTSKVQWSSLNDTASATRAKIRAQASGILRSKDGASFAFQEPFQPGVGRFMVCSLALVLGRLRRGAARWLIGCGRRGCPQGAIRALRGLRVLMPARGLVHSAALSSSSMTRSSGPIIKLSR